MICFEMNRYIMNKNCIKLEGKSVQIKAMERMWKWLGDLKPKCYTSSSCKSTDSPGSTFLPAN